MSHRQNAAHNIRSDAHLHFDSPMRLIANNFKFLDLPAVHVPTPSIVTLDIQRRKVPWLTKQLLLQSVDVVQVHMRITHCVDEFAGHQIARVRKHVCQQRVAGDVERHTQAHVAGALVEDAREVALRLALCFLAIFAIVVLPECSLAPDRIRETNIKLRKHMAGRESHEFQVRDVPGAQDDSPIVGVGFEFAHNLSDLVDPFVRVVGVAVFVRSTEMPPLETIDRAEVAFLAV